MQLKLELAQYAILVFFVLYRTVSSPDDGHIVARNMYGN